MTKKIGAIGVTVTRPTVDRGSRAYAIGDIHGRHDLLVALLEKIVNDAERMSDDRRVSIIFLGDYIDRGDHGSRVIETLRQLTTDSVERIIVLRGNHEEALLSFLSSPVSGRAWLDFGAHQTLADFGIRQPPRKPTHDDLYAIRDQLLAAMGTHTNFLKGLAYFAVDGDVIFTHAGINPEDFKSLRDQHAMIWGHPAFISNCPVPGKLLVHGHYDDLEVVDQFGRICVDTGAYYSGTLTAVRLDGGISFLSVSKI